MSQRWQSGSITSAVIQQMGELSGGVGEVQSRQTTDTVMSADQRQDRGGVLAAMAWTRRLASSEGQE